MTALGSNAIQARVAAGILVLGLVACDDGRRSHFGLPTAATAPPVAGAPPAPSPSPVPTPFGPLAYTPLEIGTVVRGPLMNPPECVGYPLWPCKYFQVTAPESGKLEALLTFSSETQGGQGVDLSVREAQGRSEVWAQSASPTYTRVEAPLLAGRTYYIIMWYAFDRLEFELTTSLKPE